MNNGPLLFLGIFFTLAFSWTGIVLTNLIQQQQAGATRPYYSEELGKAVPTPRPGLAEQGRLVYQDLGCVYCHSQQVRTLKATRVVTRNGAEVVEQFNPDIERGWGDRANVSRDYIYDGRMLLGTMRTGPDLRNVGLRLRDPDWHHKHLFNPGITSPGSLMAPFAFLYETREIKGQPSKKALNLPPEFAPPPGYEVVPTARAEALVAYLLSLKTDYALPEAPGGNP
jgi:cytochrome c oxidase cbb3-type subunit II